MKDSRGAQMFRRVVERLGSQALPAAELGTDSGAVSRWARGERRPDPRFRALLWRKYKIPFEAWDQPARARKVAA